MKRNIFAMLVAVLAFSLLGCEEEEHFLDEVKVSSSYIAIPTEGGQTTITVFASDNWTITEIPEGLSVSPTSGGAGETAVTFSLAPGAFEAMLYLNCGSAQQVLNVIQIAEKQDLPISPISDVLAAEAGTFRIRGEVYGIYNTTYGNFYMKDETGSILIYGCLDANGAEKNFSSLGIDNGDIITCEGPLTIYGGTTYELVNVTVLEIEKSLLKLEEIVYGEVAEGEEAPTAIALEGGACKAILTTKTGGVNVEIADDAKSWLSVGGVSIDGTTAVVSLVAAPNNGGARTTTVTFTAESEGKIYTATGEVKQDGSIAEVSIADFVAQPESATALYKLTGKVKSIVKEEYGNVYLEDATGEILVYGITATPLIGQSNDKSFSTLGIKPGDILTIVGTRTSYKGTAQVGGPAYYVSHTSYTEATVAEVLAAATGDTYYKITGTITNTDFKNAEVYGNFDLTDETGTIYVYGLTKAPVAKNDKSFASLGLEKGDKVTLIGKRGEYNGSPQIVGPAYYISHEKGSGGGDDNPSEIKESSVKDFIAAAEGDTQYRLTGQITNIKDSGFGNFTIKDATGEVYVYGLTATKVESNDKSFSTLGLKVGDIVTFVGTRSAYKGTAQVGGPAYYESHVEYKTLAEMNALSVGDTFYAMSGVIKEIKKADYGNVTIEDETGSIFVYGIKASATAGSQTFGELGLKVGDNVTIIGKRSEYSGSAQIGGAYYFRHEAGEGEEGGEGGEGVTGDPAAVIISEYVEGSSNNKYLEIANISDKEVDLSAYSFLLYTNGKTEPNTQNTVVLSGKLAAGAVKVYKNTNAALTLPEGVTADVCAACNFNGDDVVVLTCNGTAVDAFGTVGNAEKNYFAKDKTYRRNAGKTPTMTFNQSADWTESATDDTSGLGTR